MIAVVYSGSNYADWRLTDKDRIVASFKTNGINPYFNDEKHIIQLLNKNINLIHHAEEIKRIYFFGAGSSSTELKGIVHNALSAFFKFGKVTVDHDITGAAIACCKNSPGIISIIGSGSNAGWYDGRKVKPNNYGLGYILADEGSGNWLGKQLIKGFMNEKLPENIYKKFVQRYDFDRKTLLEKVYRQKQPAIFLSSFTEFYADNKDDNYLKNIIKTGFDLLIKTYLLPLHDEHPEALLYFAGSVAAGFQNHLYEAAADANLKIANIIKEPINNLLTYYSSKN
ncbi:MAG: BadF/BadG/BcrA/BcrD ATPase family protein [Mucilaginibacter sp.]|jgi:glucosamine kinase|nr:BadF/BadG/BcrA/BcrD ATPase family protein [Mucilaginibacter sp.]MDB5139148.1 BadF/BadG/BcrA/BcrD ATPase family protein [Mucilaginibacter sp.]